MAITGRKIIEKAAMEKRASDQRSVVNASKEIGKEREGFQKKGLGAQGRFGVRRGIERVSPRIIKKAVRARTRIDAYHTKLERLSVSELNSEYKKVAEKIKELSKKMNKAKKAKKVVFEKELIVLKETATKIGELIKSRRAEDLERSRKLSPPKEKQGVLEIDAEISRFRQEFSFIKSKGSAVETNKTLRDLISKIDIVMKTRVREMSTEEAIELSELRDSIDAKMRGFTEERYSDSQRQSISTWDSLKHRFDKEPPRFMFEKFFELVKDPEKNGRSLEAMAKFLPTKIRRTMMEIGNVKDTTLRKNKIDPRDFSEKRLALGQLRMQIEEFMGDTTRRLQLLGRTKMLDLRYVKDLYNELRKQSDEIGKYIEKLTPKQSLESERLELVREMRAKNVVLDREQQERYHLLVKKLENLVDKFGTKEAERLLKFEDTRFKELFEKEGPEAAFNYLEGRIRHYNGLQSNLIPGGGRKGPKEILALPGKERLLLESPEAAEARRARERMGEAEKPPAPRKEQEVRERAQEDETRGIELIEDETAKKLLSQLEAHEDLERKRSNWAKEDRAAIKQRLINRIDALRDSLDKNKALTGKIVRLQRELIEIAKSKGKDLEQGIAKVEQTLESLKEFVDAMDKSQAKRQIDGLTRISEMVDRFVKNVTTTLENEGKLTRDQLEEVAKVNRELAEAIKDGVAKIEEIPGKLQGLNELVDELRSASKERHEDVIKKLDLIREDAEIAKTELKEAMSEIFDARLFEINKSVKSLDENTKRVLENLGLLDGTFLSLEHFDAVVKDCMQELREGADVGVDLLLERIKEAGDKVVEKIGELDPKFAEKLGKKIEDLEEMTAQSREDILTVLSGIHDDLGKKLTDLNKKIADNHGEVIDLLKKIEKGTDADAEIKTLAEEIQKMLTDRNSKDEQIVDAFEKIADSLDELNGKLDANNQVIADILRNVIKEELNERLVRMEGKLDDLVNNGARKEDTNIIQAQIEELRQLILRNGAGGGQGSGGQEGNGPAGPGGWPPINNNNNNNNNIFGGGRGPGGEGEEGGGRPREPEPEEEGGKKKDKEDKEDKGDKDKAKDEGKKGGGAGDTFKKFGAGAMGIGIPVALLAGLLFILAKVLGGSGQTTTTSTVKAATVPIMPVAGQAASSSSFLPSGFMTPLIIILILVALFLLFPKNK